MQDEREDESKHRLKGVEVQKFAFVGIALAMLAVSSTQVVAMGAPPPKKEWYILACGSGSMCTNYGYICR